MELLHGQIKQDAPMSKIHEMLWIVCDSLSFGMAEA
jgi:hypothetical protein